MGIIYFGDDFIWTKDNGWTEDNGWIDYII